MSAQTVLRSLFTGLHERITLMEEILLRQMDSPNDGTIEKSLQITRVDPAFLERVTKLESQVKSLDGNEGTFAQAFNSQSNLLRTLKINVDQLTNAVAILQRDIRRIDAAHTAVIPTAEEVQQEIAKREVESAPEVAEAEAADLDCDEEDEEEVAEDEEVEEENDNGLIPFTYQGIAGKYYRDSDNDVFVELPESWKQVGHWDPLTKTIVFEEEGEEEVVEEEEEVEEVVEEEVVEEEVEEEEAEEEEEEAIELTEFTYKGNTYYHDSEYKVYAPDEDGAVDPSVPIGRWNPTSGKITRLT